MPHPNSLANLRAGNWGQANKPPPPDSLARDLARAADPVIFAEELGIPLHDWQKRVLRTTAKKVMLNCTRQAGKSTVTAIKAVHTLIYEPESVTLMAAPALKQTNELFDKFTKVYELAQRKGFASELVTDNTREVRTKLNARVLCVASDGGTVRGFSALRLFLEDEASYVPDSFRDAVSPMFAASTFGQTFMMSTPHGKQGHFYNEWVGDAEVETLKIEMPWSEVTHFTPRFIDGERRRMSESMFRQEYECQFTDTIDSVFHTDHITAAVDPHLLPLFG